MSKRNIDITEKNKTSTIFAPISQTKRAPHLIYNRCGARISLRLSAQCYTVVASSARPFWVLPKVRKAMGAAMKIDDSVPKITPRLIAKAKLWMLSPPKNKIQSNTISVENEVLMVRANVWLILSLNRLRKSCLGCNFMFSRIRSNTTTLSLME